VCYIGMYETASRNPPNTVFKREGEGLEDKQVNLLKTCCMQIRNFHMKSLNC
jgi:hypothetical protein